MLDITVCNGNGCPLKKHCRRYTTNPSDGESYFIEPPIKDNKCEMYWGEMQDYIINYLKGLPINSKTK